MDSGIIYPDGRIKLDGCTPTKTRLLAVNHLFLAIHHPGDRYWDNGGEHYVSAGIEIGPLEQFKRGKEGGTWRFKLKRMGGRIRFHPTPTRAVRETMSDLDFADSRGDRIAELIKGPMKVETPMCPECRTVLPWPAPFAPTLDIKCRCGAPLKMNAIVDSEGRYRFLIEGPPVAIMEKIYRAREPNAQASR